MEKIKLSDEKQTEVQKENRIREIIQLNEPAKANLEEMKETANNIRNFKMDYTDEIIRRSKKWLRDNKLSIGLSAIITFDWHIPHVSKKWINKLIEVSNQKGIRNLVIGGDFFDQEWFMLWTPSPFEVKWEEELESATEILGGLLNHFDKIYIIVGNHDLRIMNKLGKRFSIKWLFKQLTDDDKFNSKLFCSDLAWCETEDKKWIIAHPRNYSVRGTDVPVSIAEIESKNVIGGHGHHLGAALTKSGKFWGIDGGGMFAEDSFTYNGTVTKSKHPKWNNGFVTLNKNGEFRLYGDCLDME